MSEPLAARSSIASRESRFRRVRKLAGCAALILTSTTGYSMEWPPPEPVQQRVDQALSVLDQLSKGIQEPPSALEDLAFELEFDYEAGIEHVRGQVAFEPYGGVLRGPEGTGIAGAGNSWDQALLLAGLLKSMGADAQVVRGRISVADAGRLLGQAFHRAEPGPVPSAEVERLITLATEYDARMGELLGEQIAAWRSGGTNDSIDQDTAKMADALVELIAGSNLSVAAQGSADPIIERLASDYAWVRWRIGPSDPWVDLHPAFGDDTPPEAEVEQYFDSEIPTEFQHRASFRLYAERGRTDRPDDIERIAMMSAFERPIAQLYKAPLELGMIPLRIGGDGSQSFLVARLNGSLAPGAQAINELGLTAPPEDAATSAGQFIATVSSTMGDALGGVSGMESDDPDSAVPRVLGVVLEMELTAPGQPSRTVVRRMADLRDRAVAKFPGDAAFGLVIDVDVGPEPEAALVERALAQHTSLVRAMPSVLAVARGALSHDEARRIPAYRDLNGDVWLDFDLYSDAFIPPPAEGRAIYRPGPLIAARKTFTDREGRTRTATDILSNPSQVITRDAGARPVVDPRGVMRQGIRETLLESSLAVAGANWSDRTPERLVSNRPDLDRLKSERDWPTAAVEAAGRDLDNGYLVAVTGDAEPHWWRVDPRTGETLGMGMHGGQTVVEYIVMVGGAAMSSYLFFKSVESCDETYADNQQMADCCIVGNLLVTYGQAAVGGAAGGLPSGPASAHFAHPWAAGLGYFTASMQFDLAINLGVGAVTERPIEYVCREYVID